MADVFPNSPGKFMLLNGLSCHENFQKRSKFHEIKSRITYTNGNNLGLGARLCGVSFHIQRKAVKFKVFVASIEHGVVSQGGTELVEEEGGEKNRSSGNPGCGGGSSDDHSLVLKKGGMKLYYLEERNERVLSKRVLSLSRNNKRTSALRLFWSMEFSGLRPDLHACNSLLACLSRKGILDDMMQVVAIMKRDKIISGHSCSLVLKAVANHRGSDEALQMFNEWQVDDEMKQCFDVIVYNTMLSVCGKGNQWVQMERIWNSMKENGIVGTEVTYRLLVCTFVRCGQYEIATEAYAEMLQNGLKPGSDEMHAVIGAYSKEEKWDLALSVFQTMLDGGLKPNLIACNSLINSLGKAGKLKQAFKVYEFIKSSGHTPDSYTWNALLAALYRANQYVDALQFFDSIQKDWGFEPTLQLYNTALMCCQRLGFWEKALQFLWKMENSGMLVSTSSYNIVICACEVARKPKIALQVYEHMVHQKCAPDTFTHLSLIRSCVWGSLWDEVESILDDSPPNVSLYNAAIHGMCLKGRIESAKRLYLKMRDIDLVPDGKTRALMLQYMHRVNSRLEKRR